MNAYQFFTLSLVTLLVGCAARSQNTEEDLERKIRAHRTEIQECYDRQVVANPLLEEGTIRLKIVQKKNGEFERIEEVSGFPGSTSVSQCISNKIRSWQIENPSSDFTYNLRWSFVKRECLRTNSCPPDEGEKPYTDEVLDQTMDTRRAEFQACSERFSASTGDQSRRVEIQFNVDAQGTVTSVLNQNPTPENEEAYSCIQSILTGISFPPRPDGPANAKVWWTWLFPIQKWEVVPQ